MSGCSLKSARLQAKKIGATHEVLFTNITQRHCAKPKKEVMTHHFFNADGLEVAYYSIGLGDLTGLQKFETPRVWGKEIISNECYSLSVPLVG